MTRVRFAPSMTRGYSASPTLPATCSRSWPRTTSGWRRSAGGRAWRITTDHVPASRPRLSPDGRRVAWTSTVDGAPEVHVVDLDGGNRRRLTYFGVATTTVLGWTADGRVLASSHGGEQSRSRRAAYAVGLDGGAPERLPYGFVSNVALAPGGAVLAATAGTVEVAWWKGYRGGTATKLWLDRNGDGQFERLFPDERAPLESPLWLDDGATIGFVSDRDGSSDAVGGHRCRPTGCPKLARSSPPDEHRVLCPSRHVGWSSRRVPERRGDLAVGGGAAAADRDRPRRRAQGDGAPADRSQPVTSATVAPAVDGRASAVEVRGTVSWVTHRDGPVPVLAAGIDVRRRRLPVVVNSGGDVAWITDAERRRCHRVVERRRRRDSDARRRRARSGARAGRRPGRIAARRRQPRRTLVGPDRRHWRAARDRSHQQRRHHRRGLLAGLPLARLVAPRAAAARPDPPRRGRRPGGRRRSTSRRCGSPTPSRHSAPTASTWRSCRRAASTRSTTPTCSTCRSPTARRPQLVRPRRDDPLAVRSGRRRTGAGSAEGRRAPPSSAPPAVIVDAEGLDQRVVPVPGAGGPLLVAAPRQPVASPGCGRRSPARSATTANASTTTRRVRRWSASTSRRSGPTTLVDAVDRFVPTGDGNAPRRRRQARVAGHPGRPQGGAGGGGEVRRRRHGRPLPPARRRRARRGVAADVRRGRAG